MKEKNQYIFLDEQSMLALNNSYSSEGEAWI